MDEHRFWLAVRIRTSDVLTNKTTRCACQWGVSTAIAWASEPEDHTRPRDTSVEALSRGFRTHMDRSAAGADLSHKSAFLDAHGCEFAPRKLYTPTALCSRGGGEVSVQKASPKRRTASCPYWGRSF